MRESRLRRLIEEDGFVSHLELLERVDSTNEEVRRLAALGYAQGTTVIAREQTAGRGRQGRAWYSPANRGLYASVLIRPTRALREAPRWTIAASVAACEACRTSSGQEVTIRWPNDLILDGRKIGGILSELRSGAGRSAELVVGVGINVRPPHGGYPGPLAGTAAALERSGGGRAVQLERLAADYLAGFGGLCRRLELGQWAAVREAWQRLAPGSFGATVRLRSDDDGRGRAGRTAGLDGLGYLRVRREDGPTVKLRSVESLVEWGG